MTILAVAVLGGCEREMRPPEVLPSSAARPRPIVRQTTLQPGRPLAQAEGRGPYDENAYSISQGQRLFSQYNCVGCHAHGGGGMGPALIDDTWIYGSEPQNIYATILEGRPNGMPSFGGHIPEQQAWQIVAYVRAMGRLVPKAAAPGRNDHLYSGESPQASGPGEELRQPAEHPR
ncbi:MAG TPA: cytochrome c [Thermoanaerobaculia bacterium]|nr:cytochrome c [Thermoanaerobaculia bacterium]